MHLRELRHPFRNIGSYLEFGHPYNGTGQIERGPVVDGMEYHPVRFFLGYLTDVALDDVDKIIEIYGKIVHRHRPNQ